MLNGGWFHRGARCEWLAKGWCASQTCALEQCETRGSENVRLLGAFCSSGPTPRYMYYRRERQPAFWRYAMNKIFILL